MAKPTAVVSLLGIGKGAARQLEYKETAVCSFIGAHLDLFDGSKEVTVNIVNSAPPIKFVGQSDTSTTSFKFQNTTWFVSTALAAGILQEYNSIGNNLSTVVTAAIATVFDIDAYGSKQCSFMTPTTGIIDDSSSLSGDLLIDAYCDGTKPSTRVDLYARFGLDNNYDDGLRIPDCCHDPYIDEDHTGV